ncbi:hypothetical protein EYF80_001836 [Liparis tanakae]|uniref:Uncharacterized protein n=1 Tax=Liparis tanakae TaxID=230148 RepID=A0A4Z2JF18_9TELE|nr:hypothetical protein EYF80_001836 [Liparis tanakae]
MAARAPGGGHVYGRGQWDSFELCRYPNRWPSGGCSGERWAARRWSLMPNDERSVSWPTSRESAAVCISFGFQTTADIKRQASDVSERAGTVTPRRRRRFQGAADLSASLHVISDLLRSEM